MKIQIISLFLIIFVTLFFIKVDPHKPQKVIESISIEVIDAGEPPGYFLANTSNLNIKPVILNCFSPINAKIALVKYLDQSKNLFEFNIKNRWPIASLTKLMTAVIALEKINIEKEINMNKEIFKSGDLIKTMLLVSSNDAAEALAQSIGREEFIKLMNSKAKELNMTETVFYNSSGLSFLNQSTASDLIKLIDYIYNNHQEILEISQKKETEIVELKTKESRKLINLNQFAGQPNYLGGKTGYIESSGRNLIALFRKNNKVILTIILGAGDAIESAFEETKSLLNCADPLRQPASLERERGESFSEASNNL